MKKILLTGSSGFVGSNVLPLLQDKYDVFAPKRNDLDLRNSFQVKKYLEENRFDVVVHFASPSPVRSAHLDSYGTLFEDSLRIFMNFYTSRDSFGKMIYSGSGAEFDKRRALSLVDENSLGESIPADSYGLSKYIINELAHNSNNIYNLRIFACYGPGEYDSKFIRHAIQCCLKKEPITIRQDCYFDYLYIDDYAKYLMYFIENTPKFHDYNVTSGIRIKLSTIAEIVRTEMESIYPVQILNAGMNLEYSANNARIISETGIRNLISIEDGIRKLINWEKRQYERASC